MTTKTSLFNKGIYKSTLKRYAWGSALYFIILFVFTGMSILLTVDKDARYTRYLYREHSFILNNEFIIIPLLLSIAVPTICGLLIFRFIHSKKTSVFVHSLPVKREANFITSVLAGLTLMAVPVVLNALILMLLSVSGYGQFFTVTDCLMWMLCNFFGIFIMFSCVCFVSSITGNSFAMIVLNVLFHTVLLIIAACVTVVAGMFLHGFPNDNSVINLVAENIFPVRVMEFADYTGTYSHISAMDVIIPLIVSVILYVLSVILYKNRRMETAEDVAGFKCLNPIFKYLVTLVGALVAFAAGYSFMADSIIAFWIVVLIVSVVVYFACEMVLKKTFRVWKSYRGYCVFAVIFAIGMCVFAFTSFFGYETHIPENDKVKCVAVYDYYSGEEPFLNNPEIIEKAINIHKEMTENRPVTKDLDYYNYFHIKYELENGTVIHRRYGVSEENFREMMNNLYENQQYKEAAETIFHEKERITYVYIHGENSVQLESTEKIEELLECIRKDASSLSYDELYNNSWSFNVDYEYVVKEDTDESAIRYGSQNINANFKNTIAWVKENGYWDNVKIKNNGAIYIVDKWEDLPFVGPDGIMAENDPEKEANTIKLYGESAQKVIDYIHTEGQCYMDDDKTVDVYQQIGADAKSVRLLSEVPKTEIEKLTE